MVEVIVIRVLTLLCVLWFYLSPTKQKKKGEERRFDSVDMWRVMGLIGSFSKCGFALMCGSSWMIRSKQTHTQETTVWFHYLVTMTFFISCGCKVFSFFVIPHVDPFNYYVLSFYTLFLWLPMSSSPWTNLLIIKPNIHTNTYHSHCFSF